MSSSLAISVGTNFSPDHLEPVMDSLLSEYKRVIFESLVSAFALDGLLVQDHHGGDVDTIHNVRKIGDDPQMTYKNVLNQQVYEANGEYNKTISHGDAAFKKFKKAAKEDFLKKWNACQRRLYGERFVFCWKGQRAPQRYRGRSRPCDLCQVYPRRQGPGPIRPQRGKSGK